ncbi:DsbA family oxidoreductase [Hellea balneolensis]|uniref:DsbA family oxidoreductase n=1 Tax=Hellea balneolensis TaxID=287478 RepID=UPI0003FAB959|nr:DsbA family oxidoreductase [Hellea balneolensis]
MAKKNSGKSASTPIQVDIVSDIVCPWCWLGVKYFQKAAKQSGLDINLTWRPYMLDPSVPEGGVPYNDYMKQKFGTDGPNNRFKAMREALEEAAPKVGIDFKFGQIPMRPNTLNAHRLLKWAQGQDLGDAASEALFQAFFTDLEDVGDVETLTNVAAEIGMDAELVGELLTKDDDKNTVREEILFFRNLGVNGVPCFIYNGQFAVQGAQPVEAHLKALNQAAKLPPAT